jgi:hypothetical protein
MELVIKVSDENYNLEDFEDKKDFAVRLQEDFEPTEPFFIENAIVLNHYLDTITDATENTITPHEMLTETPKGITLIPDNYFHYFPDFIGPIYSFLNNCIDLGISQVEVIAVDENNENSIGKQFSLFTQHCLEKFSDRIEVSYTAISRGLSGHDQPLIRINNSRLIDQRDIGVSLNFIYESSKTFSESTEELAPSKMVFLSRKNDLAKDASDNRTLYEEECEQFFSSIGFEVINGESFETLKDEISYFRDASILVGMTGSGLTNSMFMNPGQTVIEIVCPIKFTDEPKYEIHNFYKTISMLKKHKYVAVSNINSSQEDLLEQLEAVSKMFTAP